MNSRDIAPFQVGEEYRSRDGVKRTITGLKRWPGKGWQVSFDAVDEKDGDRFSHTCSATGFKSVAGRRETGMRVCPMCKGSGTISA